MRVVSLVPSITETLLAWGVDVVACTRFCEQPGMVHVGGTKDPDLDAIVALAPDLVVLDREENRRDDAVRLAQAGLRVHVTHVVGLADVEPTMRRLAGATGAPEPDPASRPDEAEPIGAAAFVPIWRRPTMSINDHTYASSLLAHIGVSNVLGDRLDRYPVVEPSDIAALRPDLVLLPSEPYPFGERHRHEYAALVPGARVVLVDGHDLFWWGVRTSGAVERLRAALLAALAPS
jgi:ABC-type Fe3+-hydroxamate transport system substrate-binding protein